MHTAVTVIVAVALMGLLITKASSWVSQIQRAIFTASDTIATATKEAAKVQGSVFEVVSVLAQVGAGLEVHPLEDGGYRVTLVGSSPEAVERTLQDMEDPESNRGWRGATDLLVEVLGFSPGAAQRYMVARHEKQAAVSEPKEDSEES